MHMVILKMKAAFKLQATQVKSQVLIKPKVQQTQRHESFSC